MKTKNSADIINNPPLLGLIERLSIAGPDEETLKQLTYGDPDVRVALAELHESSLGDYTDFLGGISTVCGPKFKAKVNRSVLSLLGEDQRNAAEKIVPGISNLPLDKDGKGIYLNSYKNVDMIIGHLCEGKICWDTFTHRYYFTEIPNWSGWKRTGPPGPLGWTLIDDTDKSTLVRILSDRTILPKFRSFTEVDKALRRVAKSNYTVDYYQEIFNRLPEWDGVPRLDTWAEDYLHAVIENDNERRLIRAFCRRFIISMHYRCYKAPCNIRGTLILEGSQGIGKSRFVKQFGHPFPGELTAKKLDLHGGTANDVQGKIVVEIAEFDAMRGTDESAMKEFLTRVTDTYTRKWIVDAEDFHRRTVMIATINPGWNGYLKDATGHSRMWPIKCEFGKKIDVFGFGAVRDQIFAEAKVAFLAGERHYLDDEEEKIHAIYVSGREYESPAVDIVLDFIEANRGIIEVSGLKVSDLTEYWQGRPPSNKDLSDALQQCGLESIKIYVGKNQRRFWIIKGTEEAVKRNLNSGRTENIVQFPIKKPD